MKKTNGENGITLIALVVTIVVLLILAGITITYVMADGGIFDSAKQAATATITSQIADYASQIQATYMTQMAVKNATGVTPSTGTVDLTGEITTDGEEKTVTTLVQKFFPSGYVVGGTVSLTGDGQGKITSGGYEVTYNGNTYTVTYKDGAATVVKKP